VPPEKLSAEREAINRQQEYNSNYTEFLKDAVFPAVDLLVQMLRKVGLFTASAPGATSFAARHLAWRWGELVIMQSHQDAVTFEHHIITEGEKRGDDSAEDHSHQYDLRDPLPQVVAEQELQFFLGRMAQDLVEPEDEPEIPPGEKPPVSESSSSLSRGVPCESELICIPSAQRGTSVTPINGDCAGLTSTSLDPIGTVRGVALVVTFSGQVLASGDRLGRHPDRNGDSRAK